MKKIDVEYEVESLIEWIREYFVENGPNSKAVIGISGGKDSTVAAALLVRALGPDNVIGVLMPQGVQKDIKDSYRVCDILGIKYHVVNIEDICDSLYNGLKVANLIPTNQVLTNTPSRIRMSVLYAIAAIVGGRVANTCNYSEDYIGYSTKYGDLAGDFSILQNYCVREVIEIGDYLGLPYELVHKIPADGMCGLSDEENLGFTYEELDNWIIDGKVENYEKYKLFTVKHENSRHKITSVRLPAKEPVRSKYIND